MSLQENVCVNCGRWVSRLYIQYSAGNIRLMKCESCKAIVDPFIECEFMIILIDLILHKPPAYRHVLYNKLNVHAGEMKGILWKAYLVYFFLDACRFSLSTQRNEREGSSSLFPFWTFGKVVADVLSRHFLFFSFLLYGTRTFSSTVNTRFEEILVGIIISSYLKLSNIATMVWQFPNVIYFIMDVFVLSSNIVALQGYLLLGVRSFLLSTNETEDHLLCWIMLRCLCDKVAHELLGATFIDDLRFCCIMP